MNKKQLKKLEKKEANRRFKEWAISVKERDGNKCVICGNTIRLNAHHLIPREIKEHRFDIQNGLSLCPKCHKWGIYSFHRNPLWGIAWLIDNRTEQFEYLDYSS